MTTSTPRHKYIVQWHGEMDTPDVLTAAVTAMSGLTDPMVNRTQAHVVVIGITGPDRGKQFEVDMRPHLAAPVIRELDQPARQMDPQEAGLIELG